MWIDSVFWVFSEVVSQKSSRLKADDYLTVSLIAPFKQLLHFKIYVALENDCFTDRSSSSCYKTGKKYAVSWNWTGISDIREE